MSYQSFETIAQLLATNQIVSFNVNEKFINSSGNVVAVFLDLNANQWHCILRYDKINNRISPPAPSVICLKGTIHQYGSNLENAPPNLVYIGRNLTMGGGDYLKVNGTIFLKEMKRLESIENIL